MGRLPEAEAARESEHRTLEGLTVLGCYSAQPLADAAAGGAPGRAPFVRGARAERDPRQPWRILARLPEDADAAAANAAALEGLEGGAGGLLLPAAAAGWNSAEAERALRGVHLEGVAIHFAAAGEVSAAAVATLGRAAIAGADLGDWCLGVDPLRATADACGYAIAAAAGARALSADAEPFHDAGAHAALELGLLLSATAQALRALDGRAAPEQVLAATAWRIPLERDFFGGVMKLRAARLLWSALARACGVAPPPPWLHACGSRRTLTRRDPHANLVRATVQAAAAACGSADAISLPGFDEADGAGGAFGRRLARNVALVVEHEARLLDVQDPGGGSEHFEQRTRELARASWEEFRALEADGGAAAALAGGRLRARLDAEWERRATRLRAGEDALIGVNRHAAEAPAEPAPPPHAGPWGLPIRREEEACAGLDQT